uniref:Putative secreted protein n=1 Tax=Ixodes ricinus TaxID=34613 RepID=A0A6B0TSP0_IXORI
MEPNSTKGTMMALLFFVGLVSPAIAHRKSVKSQRLHCVPLVYLAIANVQRQRALGPLLAQLDRFCSIGCGPT